MEQTQQKIIFIDNAINIIASNKETIFKDILLDNLFAYNSFEYTEGDYEGLKKSFLSIDIDSINKYILTDALIKEYLSFFDIEIYEEYIQLSNYPVLNDINAEIDSETYFIEVENALANFANNIKKKYDINIKIINIGRSGKHIVIESFNNKLIFVNNIFNIIDEYNNAENDFITYINETYKK